MRAKEFEVRAMLLLVIVAETAGIGFLVYKPKPAARSEFSVQPGSRISLLIDGERFPVDASSGQKVTMTVENNKKAPPMPPSKPVINLTEEQEKMTRVREPRFRFYFDDPKELRWFFLEQKLEKLRGNDEWATIENVLKWTRSQFEPATPGTYPTQNAMKLLPILKSGKEKGGAAQYCFILVQSLQAMDFKARYVTLNGHEICEVWSEKMRRWIALDPLNAAYFEDLHGRKLSAVEVYKNRDGLKVLSEIPDLDSKSLASAYRVLKYWLRNDLYTTAINPMDLDLYRVRLVLDPADFESIKPSVLCTVFTDELYSRPEPNRKPAGAAQ